MQEIFQSYSYQNLPKQKHGLISPEGWFIPYNNATSKNSHEKQIKVFIEEQLGIDIISIFQEKKDTLKNPNLYLFRDNIYDYKSMLLDFLGYCNYETYTTSPIAVIEIPLEEISNKKITDKQLKVLEELVRINQNDDISLQEVKKLMLKRK